MKTNTFTTSAIACVLLLAGFSSLQAGVSGAIFTTVSDGTVVNANQYNSPCAVYLDGGPGLHAPAKAAGLPDGDYYFQVTDPSGKQLLSTDIVLNRSFHVSGGVIMAYTGTGGPIHVTNLDRNQPGAVTIALANMSCPTDFLMTSNNGGAFKVWVAPVGSFNGNPALVDNPCGNGCFHGFVPSASKTDNFKVNTTTATFCLTIQKQFLQMDGSLTPGTNWEFDVTDSQQVTNKFFTDTITGQVMICDLTSGTYTVAEDLNAPVVNVTGNVTLTQLLPTSVSFTWSFGMPTPMIVFTNNPPQQPQ